MMRVLIGYDGSESANVAVSDLKLAGLPPEAQALIVSVGDVLMAPPPSSYEVVGQALASRRVTSSLMVAQTQAARALKEAKEFASIARGRVRSLFPGWDVRAESLAGTPAHELIRRAQEWMADLVVVGSKGHGAAARFILGSVSKKVVNDSHSSVRVARSANENRDGSPPRIIIGVDGSDGAERAVRSVGGRVWPVGTEVRVIAVDDGTSPTRINSILPDTAAMIRGYNEEAAVAAGRMVEWAADELGAIGLNVSITKEKGNPRRVLVDEAQTWAADSIFVGPRNFSGAFERFRLGSVSSALVTKAPCTVEVVR